MITIESVNISKINMAYYGGANAVTVWYSCEGANTEYYYDITCDNCSWRREHFDYMTCLRRCKHCENYLSVKARTLWIYDIMVNIIIYDIIIINVTIASEGTIIVNIWHYVWWLLLKAQTLWTCDISVKAQTLWIYYISLKARTLNIYYDIIWDDCYWRRKHCEHMAL